MIPIKDTVPTRTVPVVTLAIIAVNGLIYLFEAALPGRTLGDIVYLYGLVPARYTHPAWAEYQGLLPHSYWPFLTNMFLHGSWLHVISNMWFLYLFGDNVEDRLGHVRYLGFYLVAGLAANVVHFAMNASSTMPVIGASGAIAGVMGAYLRMYPSARIVTLVPILFLPYFFEVPAFLFMGIWFLIQVISGAASFAVAGGGAGIAWWAHIGGFAAGYFLIKPLCGRRAYCHPEDLRHFFR